VVPRWDRLHGRGLQTGGKPIRTVSQHLPFDPVKRPREAYFLTVEVWKLRGLITYYVLFFIELPTRTVRIAGITTSPAEGWMLQIARNACDVDDGVLSEGRKLLIDRDAKYSGD
jgi:hypothetical protein